MNNSKIRASNNGYSMREPLNDFHRSMGYICVINPGGEILKFYMDESDARKYFNYVSLTKWEKLKYWLNYKRGTGWWCK